MPAYKPPKVGDNKVVYKGKRYWVIELTGKDEIDGFGSDFCQFVIFLANGMLTLYRTLVYLIPIFFLQQLRRCTARHLGSMSLGALSLEMEVEMTKAPFRF